MTRIVSQRADDAEWPHRDASRFVEAGGLRWHVQQWGSSPATLLLLHGTGASTHSWRKLAPLLARRFSVLAPDLPGHGLSAMLPRERRSMAGMALATRELLKSLALRPAGVLGHSAGAALMLRLALDGDLNEAVLIGVNAALLPFEGVAGRLYAPIARLLARSPLPARFAAWRARDVANVQRLIAATGSRLDSQGVALYRGLLRRPDHVAGVLAMMANWDLAALASELPGLHARLHLVVGESDAIVAPAQAERVAARLRGTAVHRLPGLGHLAHEEAPDRVARIVLDLLPGPPSGGG